MNQQLLKKLEPYITINPGVMNGAPRFKDTRIPVSIVVDHFAGGWNIQEIAKLFPDVKQSVIKKTISLISSEL